MHATYNNPCHAHDFSHFFCLSFVEHYKHLVCFYIVSQGAMSAALHLYSFTFIFTSMHVCCSFIHSLSMNFASWIPWHTRKSMVFFAYIFQMVTFGHFYWNSWWNWLYTVCFLICMFSHVFSCRLRMYLFSLYRTNLLIILKKVVSKGSFQVQSHQQPNKCLNGNIQQFKRRWFDPGAKLDKDVSEGAVDHGGPSREYFHLLMKATQHSKNLWKAWWKRHVWPLIHMTCF